MIKPEAIHMRAYECRDERAEFLWNMYRNCSRNSQHSLVGPYLDIGTGDLTNALLFRKKAEFENAIGIDIESPAERSREIALVRGDARALPFRDGSFALVTMISLIEHLREQALCVSEAARVLRNRGELFMQLPNRYFPIELHSGLFIYFFLPSFIRNRLASYAGRSWMKNVDVPPLRKVMRIISESDSFRGVVTASFSYPESLLPLSRWTIALYRLLKHLGILQIMPMGYVVLAHLSRVQRNPDTRQRPTAKLHDATMQDAPSEERHCNERIPPRINSVNPHTAQVTSGGRIVRRL